MYEYICANMYTLTIDIFAQVCYYMITARGTTPSGSGKRILPVGQRREREWEITRSAALRNMRKFGLEPCEENLDKYFRRAREALPPIT